MNDLYSPQLTAPSLAKLTMSNRASLGCEKFGSEILKVKFLRLCFIFVTYLPREVDGRVINDIYFLDETEYEDLRDSS